MYKRLSITLNNNFRPTGEISFPDEYHGLFTDDLTMVAEGSTLFNVYALDAPEDLGGQEEWIGKPFLVFFYIQPPGEHREHHLGKVLKGRSKSKFNITLS